MGQAIKTFTGNYSYVAIYLDEMIYHASGKTGVICKEAADLFESNHLYDLYVYPELDIQSVKERACKHLGASYNASFYPDGAGF